MDGLYRRTVEVGAEDVNVAIGQDVIRSMPVKRGRSEGMALCSCCVVDGETAGAEVAMIAAHMSDFGHRWIAVLRSLCRCCLDGNCHIESAQQSK